MTAAATATGLMVLDATRPADRATWLEAWEGWPGREVFAHPAYVALDAATQGGQPLAALWRDDAGTVLYPFILRDLRGERCWDPQLGEACDLVTPYGYGGVFAWGRAPRELAAGFRASFDAWAAGAGVVSEFVRLALFPDAQLPYPGELRERGGNVVRTLDLDADAMWMDYEHKVRKNVRKAERSGLRVIRDPAGERLDDFLRIYHGTMARRGADGRYRLPREYFETLVATLPGGFTFFHVAAGDVIVSTELVLVSAEHVYSFLGGTADEAFALRPNDLLKHAVIGWAREAGKRSYVLGGGYRPDDGIFRYKLSFAPHGVRPFHTGERILRPEAYARLTRNALGGDAAPAPGGFFPAYRQPPARQN